MQSTRLPAVALLAALAVLSACAPATAERTARNGELPAGVSTAFAGLLQLDPATFREQAEARGFATTAAGVVLDIQTEGLEPGHRAQVEQAGVVVRSFRPRYERISAIAARPQVLSELAALSYVRMIAPAYGAIKSGGDGGY